MHHLLSLRFFATTPALLGLLAGCGSDPECLGHDDETCEHHDSTSSGLGTSTSADAASEYCLCAFAACHDEFHLAFGPDDNDSRAACRKAAAALPAGNPGATSGASLNCRQNACKSSGAAACKAILGQAICVTPSGAGGANQ